jgi:hypothetical protein
MRYHDEKEIGTSERLSNGTSERFEALRDDRDCGNAALLNGDRVVDTPRRARSSITHSVDSELSGSCLRHVFRCSRKGRG